MQKYQIILDEAQRQIIAEALIEKDFSALTGNHPDTGYPMNEEATVLLDMFTSLPADEAETPDAIHSFCL